MYNIFIVYLVYWITTYVCNMSRVVRLMGERDCEWRRERIYPMTKHDRKQAAILPHIFFSEIVGLFLEQRCESAVGQQISDEMLFPKFRAFWVRTTQQAEHPALLGQFRVELTLRGYRSTGAKRPCWYDLTLRM